MIGTSITSPREISVRTRPIQLSFFDGDDRQPLFSPLDATFQQNKEEPLHNWYPYLEGFGPDFVQSVFTNYLLSAKRIIDPFVPQRNLAVELLKKQMRDGQKRGEKLGLTDDEVAFYDALEVNDSAEFLAHRTEAF